MADPQASRVLFLTSNGTGLGHLTRSMAIARRLEPGIEPVFFTLSAAAPVVREQGFLVDYMGSYDTPGAGSHLEWSRRLAERVTSLLADVRPGVVVFDGAHPYPAAVEVLRDAGAVTVWSRRPLWRPRRGRAILALAPAFDLVLEPGELAAADDAGLTVARREEAIRVDPIVFCDPSELLPRDEAERVLGLEPGRVHVLVALGQGPEVDAAVRRCLARLAPEPGVQVAALESSLSSRLDVPNEVVHLRDTYPVSRYYRAFDFAVSAAGYNAYHELIELAVPTVFVPMPRELDDQAARARHAARAGLGLACEGPGSGRLDGLLDEMLDAGRRSEIERRARELHRGNGAAQAARLLSELAIVDGRRRAAELPHPRGGAVAMWGTMARARASAVVRHPFERRRSPAPEVACVALGAPPGELGEAVRRLVAETRNPGRVLVLTDSEDFSMLREAGVAFQYVPPRSDVERHLRGVDYDAMVRARIDACVTARHPGRVEVLR